MTNQPYAPRLVGRRDKGWLVPGLVQLSSVGDKDSEAVKESGQLETEEAEEVEELEGIEEYSVTAAAPGVSYYTHVQNIGDQAAVANGAVSGAFAKETSYGSVSYRYYWVQIFGGKCK